MRSRSRPSGGRSTACRPTPAAGSPPRRATGRSIVSVDDQLRLIFLCCHPALGADAQVALTLRLLGGLTTAEIARAFRRAGRDDEAADALRRAIALTNNAAERRHLERELDGIG
jgi:predicted RNA polymerase sigma factor